MKFKEYNRHIKFTMELESDGKIPFLDMLLIRNVYTGVISTEWYMKPIASGRILNFYSAHNFQQKISTASGLVHRIISLTSTRTMNTNVRIRSILKSNNYPMGIINIFQTIDDTSQGVIRIRTKPIQLAEQPKIHRSLLFVVKLSFKITKLFKQWIPGLVVGHKCPVTVGSIFTKLKDPLEKWKKNNLIYEIPCE